MKREADRGRGLLDVVASAFTAVGNFLGNHSGISEQSLRGEMGPIREEPGVVDVLSFRSVVEWLTENRPAVTGVNAVILREKQADCLRMITVYITASGKPLTDDRGFMRGRVQRALQLDQELLDFFGNHSMVLFK
ncbi:MAG: hypothetical protein ACKO2L_18130 [Planctomycetaceae bacterium]